jgi:16S rRNA (guanine966-N2)-methyltransferase
MAGSAGRVIAGSARGTRLLSPGEGTRPLGDRVKQTLFAVLEAGSLGRWPVPFLDLYAGSGAGGIEALSRGAPRAVFVEKDADALGVIGENLRRARLDGGGRIVRGDVLAVLGAGAAAHGGPFGTVLLDPPYADATIIAALERLADPALAWLEPDAVVAAKHFWRDPLPERVGGLERRRERRFGETMLTFYVRAGPARIEGPTE